MAELSTRRILSIVPLLALLGLSAVCLQRGAEGPWHGRCVQLWKEGKWQELTALAKNLDAIQRPDTEAYFFAALASVQQGEVAQARQFLDRLLQQRFLNREMEKQLDARIQPADFLQLIRIHRSSASLAIFLLLVILNLFSWKWKAVSYWTGALSTLGCAILLI